MKILLIEPPKLDLTIGGDDVFLFEPLALEYLAAGVMEEHAVEILDMRLDKKLEQKLVGFQPDIVGITAYTVHVNVVKALFEQVKAWNKQVLTVAGGHHATVMPEDFITPFIDHIVMGEGVFAFKEIVSRFANGVSIESISGLYTIDENNNLKNEYNNAINLDGLPFPIRKLTAKYRKHYYSEWMKPLASIRTSKGCPHRCTFCAQWKIAEGKYLKREPQYVVDELAEIEEECVFFADDESLLDTDRMHQLAQLIAESGIKKRYFLYGRSDTVANNPDLLKAWRDVGLERVFIGLESFRKEDLEYIRKRSTLEENEQAVKILQDLGIDVYASFILQPTFTKQDFAALKKYCRKLNLSFASFAVLTPLPGTDLYDELEDQLIMRNYDCYDFIHTLLPTTLSLKEFYKEYHDLLKHGIAFHKQLAFMMKFRKRDIPGVISMGLKFYKRLKLAYLDYS